MLGDSETAPAAHGRAQVEDGERFVTNPALFRGMRAHWSADSDYQFVLVLAQHTVCNERQGLILNHKYIDPAVVKDIAAGLDNNTHIDDLVKRLAQKYATKKEEHRSYECIGLISRLREKVPQFSWDQLNHKHINMWTRTIVPFRQLFHSGQLFRGKHILHKDCKRFTKAIIDYFVHIIAKGMSHADPNMFVKGADRGSRLLEQWLTAMLVHHGQDMVNFLFVCGTRLATSFIDSKSSQEHTPQDTQFLNTKSPRPEQVLHVLKELMCHIVRNETYNALSIPREDTSTPLSHGSGTAMAASSGMTYGDSTPPHVSHQWPRQTWTPEHGPYRARGADVAPYPRDDYRTAAGGMPDHHYHHYNRPASRTAAGPHGFLEHGHYDQAPYEPLHRIPPGGRHIHSPPEDHRSSYLEVDPYEMYRSHPDMRAPRHPHSNSAGLAGPTRRTSEHGLSQHTGRHHPYRYRASPLPAHRSHPEPVAQAQHGCELAADGHERFRPLDGAPFAGTSHAWSTGGGAQQLESRRPCISLLLSREKQPVAAPRSTDASVERSSNGQLDQSASTTRTTPNAARSSATEPARMAYSQVATGASPPAIARARSGHW